jgi:hypothetical protein
MSDHTHDYWRTPGGVLECPCGASRGPALPLTADEQATVDRFGIFEEAEQ